MNSALLFQNNDGEKFFINIKKRTFSVFKNGSFVKETPLYPGFDFEYYEKMQKTSTNRKADLKKKHQALALLDNMNARIVTHVREYESPEN